MFGEGEFLPQDDLTRFLAKIFCPLDRDDEDICESVFFLICGFDEKNMNLVWCIYYDL